MSWGTVGRGHRAWVLSKTVIYTMVFFHALFAEKQATLHGPESEERYSIALTTTPRQPTTSYLISSNKVLAMKLDWLPPSKTHRASLFSLVGPMTHMRAVCEVKPGEARSILPTVVCAVSIRRSSGLCSLHIDLWCAPLYPVHKALFLLPQFLASWPRFKQVKQRCADLSLSTFAYFRHLAFLSFVTLWLKTQIGSKYVCRLPWFWLLSFDISAAADDM